MSFYVDSSFLVSRYIADCHSLKVDQRLSAKPSIWITPFNRSEIANAIYRQAFLNQLALPEAQVAWNDFEEDCQLGVWIGIKFPERAWETSIALARRFSGSLGVRTLDSLHVACALELSAEKFWTFDDRQAKLAEAVGLDTSA
ncbi:MAG: type II toxin-antitoxin system VapC family toxin [Terracidiphilus sp.]|nr:type II toxin-antitoxin system VapC family toxin [Terracidiphilus sp.]